jgi:methyl-accepting chemotaxis protein
MRHASEMAEEQVNAIIKVEHELQTIAEAVREITSLNQEMENAANEQSDVSESINQNVIEISRSAEQTSSDAQETARVAADLLAMAETLHNTIEQFRLSKD